MTVTFCLQPVTHHVLIENPLKNPTAPQTVTELHWHYCDSICFPHSLPAFYEQRLRVEQNKDTHIFGLQRKQRDGKSSRKIRSTGS